MNINDVQLLFDYNYWATELILNTAKQLTPEQFTQQTSFPWKSVRETLIHMVEVENSWRYICQHNRIRDYDLEVESATTLDEIIAFWKKDEAEMQAYLGTLQDSDMENIIRYDVPSGGVRARRLWHCLVHVVNHGTQHRSEVAAMLTEFGHSPGDYDMSIYTNMRFKLS